MNPALFFISQRSAEAENRCRNAIASILRANDMRSVSMHADVSIPVELRAIKNTIPSYSLVRRRAEDRMNEILSSHLDIIVKQESVDDRKAVRAKFMNGEWRYLRGDYSNVFLRAIRESDSAIIRTPKAGPEAVG